MAPNMNSSTPESRVSRSVVRYEFTQIAQRETLQRIGNEVKKSMTMASGGSGHAGVLMQLDTDDGGAYRPRALRPFTELLRSAAPELTNKFAQQKRSLEALQNLYDARVNMQERKHEAALSKLEMDLAMKLSVLATPPPGPPLPGPSTDIEIKEEKKDVGTGSKLPEPKLPPQQSAEERSLRRDFQSTRSLQISAHELTIVELQRNYDAEKSKIEFVDGFSTFEAKAKAVHEQACAAARSGHAGPPPHPAASGSGK